MDVILRNDPSFMDLQSYNEFTSDDVYDSEIFVEGAVGDKVKNIINRIAEFIKTIINKIRGYFAEARIKKYKRMVDDPKERERLQQNKVAKWDTENNQKFYTAGFDIADFAMKCFGNVVSEQSTRNLDKDLKTLEAKKSEIKTLVENSKKTDRLTNEKWSEYEALNALIDESTSAAKVAFVMESFYNLIKGHKRGKYDSLYGVEGVSKEKVLQLFTITSEILGIYSAGCVAINRAYGLVAHSAGSYRGRKAYNTFSKNVREAIKKQGGDPDNVLMVKVKSVKQEYYTGDGDDISLDELDAYIEYAMDDLHDAMELRNSLIQESDDDTVEDFEESDTTDETPDDVEECGDGCKPTTEYYSDAIVRNYNEPVQENKTYCLKTNNMFTESYDEPTGPDRFVQESYIRRLDLDLDDTLTEEEFFDEHYVPEIYKESYIGAAVGGAVLGFALGSALSAGIIYIDKLITDNKYGRFPKDMKAVYDIIKTEGFEASDNTKKLKKAFRHLNADLVYMLGGFGSRWKLTVDEAEEVKKLKDYVDDLYTRGWMLTKNKEKSDKRRVPERIEAFVKQGNKVLELLSKSEYKSELVKEYMS